MYGQGSRCILQFLSVIKLHFPLLMLELPCESMLISCSVDCYLRAELLLVLDFTVPELILVSGINP